MKIHAILYVDVRLSGLFEGSATRYSGFVKEVGPKDELLIGFEETN